MHSLCISLRGQDRVPSGDKQTPWSALSILLTLLKQTVLARPAAILSKHRLLVCPTVPRETSSFPCEGHWH